MGFSNQYQEKWRNELTTTSQKFSFFRIMEIHFEYLKDKFLVVIQLRSLNRLRDAFAVKPVIIVQMYVQHISSLDSTD